MTIILDPDESIVVCFTTLLPLGLYQVSWSLINWLDSGAENIIILDKQVRWGEMLLCAISAMMKIFFCDDDGGKIVVCHNGTKSSEKNFIYVYQQVSWGAMLSSAVNKYDKN